ncbi:MAG TPA: hypothetical protein VKY74_17580, partial [Chloroflexia bacterium]|nr:hypothetical protein [Chloroflexia bacterium]
SNSLLECLVFGRRAALAALADGPAQQATWAVAPLPAGAPCPPPATRMPRCASAGFGPRLDRDLGVERDASRLARLVGDLPGPDSHGCPADHLIATLATRAALLRTESRGAHYRVDAPTTQPAWQGRILWRRETPPHFEEVPVC